MNLRVTSPHTPDSTGMSPQFCSEAPCLRAAERLQTVWLPLIKRAAPNVPQLSVRFTAVGAELRAVSVEVGSLQPRYLKRHVNLVEEWKDSSKWPKHLLVEYEWDRYQDENVEGGVFVLLTTCAPPLERSCWLHVARVPMRALQCLSDCLL